MSASPHRAEKRGQFGDALTALMLWLKLYRIIGRSVKTHAGEIDLVALSASGLVCFIEVKARADMRTAAESVGAQQRARIARAASLYLAGRLHLAGRGVRFDIVAVARRSFPRYFRDAWRPE